MTTQKPSLLFESKHLDYAGGGTHSRQIIFLLSRYFTIYCDKGIFQDIEKYNEDIPPFAQKNEVINNPDVYITVDHSGKVKPKGKLNIVISFYPSNQKPKGFDYAICANKFVQNAIKKNWGMKSLIIPPFRNEELYKIGKKENSCIAIGNFFLDKDGFSKNQHLLIDWYIKNKKILNLSKFELFGFPNNRNYVDICKELSKNHSDITLYIDASRSQIRESLEKSKYLLHAHGYGRKNPDQVEHFGIIAIEALLSGTLPIVHNSGGCKDILGTKSFEELEDINKIILSNKTSPSDLKLLGEIYSTKNVQELIPEIYEKIHNLLLTKNKSFLKNLKKNLWLKY